MKISVKGFDFDIDEQDIDVFNSKEWKVLESAKGYRLVHRLGPVQRPVRF
jgi:hypothetical protein